MGDSLEENLILYATTVSPKLETWSTQLPLGKLTEKARTTIEKMGNRECKKDLLGVMVEYWPIELLYRLLLVKTKVFPYF